ncbi:MAG TPA: TonB-dependent receptor [Usitatibacter sp.]|nr:TonB-dependent receptor [Usitatibacter sp.]
MNPRLLAAILAAFAPSAFAQQQETVVVTATRLPQAGFDVPAAVDAIDGRVIREGNPQVNLSETLNRVPGIVVQNRQNYAQDLQISSRGFGARSTFGVRGVRLIADGIPATMPDGQGQAATFDLASAERIEILRGPFASLYGNSSGGVVQVFTADGPERRAFDLGFMAGSFGQWRANARLGGQEGALNYIVNASRFHTDGYRDHSAATRDQLNAKFRGALGPGTVTVVLNALSQPDTDDPLGLTRAQFEADPRQVDPAAIQFDTRKSIRQGQSGVVYDAALSATDSLHARLYLGDRRVVQFLGQEGDTPLGSGGVVDLDRTYGGIGLRWTRRAGAWTLSIGADTDQLDERRRGYVNSAGRQGALRRDEDDTVLNTDAFAQFEWRFAPAWSVSGGARHSRVRFSSRDYYVSGPNPDDSGSVSFRDTTPVVGIMFKPSERVHWYANAGEGFETPTFAELAYRPGGATGLNFALAPSRNRQYEAGVKARLPAGVRVNAAIFRTETRDEIVTNASSGGRTDFKNASRTLRDGVELAFESRLPGGVTWSVAYTGIRARFTEGFTAGTTFVAAGRRLPGVPPSVLQADLAWRGAGAFAGIEVRRSGKVYVNEANTDAAAAYTVANVRAGYEAIAAGWRYAAFVRVDNVADRRYAGSVIVAEARGRFFEPAPGRAYFGGVEVSRAF